MNSILVTGGAGYVGSACCGQLLQRGLFPEVLDDLSTGHVESVPKELSLHRFDYGDCGALESLLRSKQFDTVFHFAAKALIPESVTNPGIFFSINVASGIAMLETLRPMVDRLVLTVPPSIPVMQRWSLEDMGPDVSFEPDFERALHDIQEDAATVLVTGSFHTVGDALARLPGFAPVG